MKVSDILPKLVKNEEFQIRISDEDNRSIITFDPAGHVAISDELNNREVEEVIIADGVKIIKIHLTAVTNDDPVNPDPSNGGDPSNP